jgi:CRISPR-associated protein Cas2
MPRNRSSTSAERWYVVTYDIADQKRWRRIYRLMKGYGRSLQLSVFQCRLTAKRRAEMAERLERWIKRDADHILIIDLGPADGDGPSVESLGKTFAPIRREAIVI